MQCSGTFDMRLFKIYSDASDIAGAAILTQDFEEGNKPIYYHFFKFTPSQQKYSAAERECLAVTITNVDHISKEKNSCLSQTIRHSDGSWKPTRGKKRRIAGWSIRLQAANACGDMIIEHRDGKRWNSRMPCLDRSIYLK